MIVKWVRTMPSVVGNLVVQNSNGSFNLGDFYNVSPKETRRLIMDLVLPTLVLLLILLMV